MKSIKVDDFFDSNLRESAGILEIRGPASIELSSLEFDSRHVKQGAMFFAQPGLHVDGHDFIPGVLGMGAAGIVHEKEQDYYKDDILYIRVRNSRFSMSPIADKFYSYPSRKMGVIGVTGTEGKSTTVFLIYQLLKLLGKKAGFISTANYSVGLKIEENPEHQTTPEAIILHRLLDEMHKTGVEYAVLESSSHGLSKRTNRLGDVAFDVGVMTNVNHDHIEFHGSWEQYRSDKAELFRSLNTFPKAGISSFGVANADDASASYFAEATRGRTYLFSAGGRETSPKADLRIESVENKHDGNCYNVFDNSKGRIITINDKLPGAFNPGNVLAALLVVSNLLSVDIEELAPLAAQLKPVHGRMTVVSGNQPFTVLVDYAHTPSAFEAVIPPLKRQISSTGGRLICLFGSAGERDTEKRRLQGEIAAGHSDIIVLTDEDPRGEDSMTILEDIADACKAFTRGENLFLIPNRPEAIRKAFSLTRKGDIVLLLGKGHENSIIYASETIPYDEVSEAEVALGEMGFN
ncbi:MAG: UDP-N-acetylmuramoyl-L-alanyl-D-glutamate--2,6-diaminopimelate ligase [Treponema sp.]|nr:UDP-N-acetylmuramoyl-L-alanyl-D-glutamate--2,6-diaminopimelate ligase [Treponema sp.]